MSLLARRPETPIPQADVLGRLLVIQHTLDVLPNEEAIAAFLGRALREVPGVSAVHLAAEGGIWPPDPSVEEAHAALSPEGATAGAPLPGLPATAAFPLRTARRLYGALVLVLDEDEAFEPYRVFLSNIAGAVTASLETRELLQLSAAARSELELRVEERTRELAERNERLAVEAREREKATAALAEGEEQIRLIAAYAKDAIVILDEDGRVTTWNRAAERVFGRPAAEILGHEIDLALVPAGSRDAYRRGFSELIHTGSGPILGRTLEATALRADGSELPIEISVSAIKVRGRWHALGIVRDISERKRAEAVREELAAIVRSTTDAVIGKTLEGIATTWNAGAERLYGYTAAEMTGHPLTAMVEPERSGEVQALIEEVRQGRAVEGFETRRIHKDGRVLDVSLTLSPIRDEAETIVGASTIARDVTRRKRAESSLRESEARLAEAERIAHLGSWSWDCAAGSLVCSDEVYEIFHLTPEQAGGSHLPFLDRVHPADRDLVRAVPGGNEEGGARSSLGLRLLLPDGSVRYVHVQAESLLDRDGRPARVVGTVQDVTDLKRSELALLRTNRALRTLSSCNQTLVRATSEVELLEGMCVILVEEGGFRCAWVGLGTDESAELVPAAWCSRDGSGKARSESRITSPGSPDREVAWMAVSSCEPRVRVGTSLGPAAPDGASDGPRLGAAAIAAVPLLQEGRALGALVLHADEPGAFDEEEVKLVSELGSDLAFGIETLRARAEKKEATREKQKYLVQLRQNLEDTVAAIAATVEARDPYTAGHQRRVAEFAAAIAKELGLGEEAVQGIHLAGTIHDLGKIKVPAEILSRPGQLSEIEMRLIRIHPEAGWEILKGVEFPWPIAEMVLEHHERLDGSGYPRGLKGEQISLGARILAVADVVEATASHRPYRASRGLNAALSQLESDRGVTYDAAVVDACLRLFREQGYRFQE